jgi:hypothetical protein
MAERLVTLPATQVAWVRFLVTARPTFRVEKVALFCNPASGDTFSSTAIELIKRVNFFCSRACEGVPHHEAWVRIVRGIPHVKGYTSVLRLRYSKEKMR